MKIITNFSTPAGRMTPYLMGMLLLFGSVAVIASISLWMSTYQMSAEVSQLEKKLVRYRSREVQPPVSALSNRELSELRSRIKRLNELTNTAEPTLAILFLRLEKLIPDDVWLASLQYRSHQNETKLLAEAKSAKKLTSFLRRLERSGLFSQVLLTRQSQHTGATNVVQFEIQLRSKP